MSTAVEARAAQGVPLPPGAPGPGAIRSYEGAKGRTLRYRLVEADRPRRLLLYLHGIESHATWFLPAAFDLAARGCTTCLLDRRGSGLNRDTAPGDAESEEVLLDDVRRLRASLGEPDLHLVGLSWGGKLALAAALDRPQGVRSLVLITPGLKARVGLAPWQALRFVAGLACGGRTRIRLPLVPEMFTATPEHLEFIRGDPWRLHAVSARFLRASLRLDRKLRREVSRLALPVLLLLAGRERIIDNDGVRRVLAPLRGGRLTVRTYAEATHSIQFDQRTRMVADMLAFYESLEAAC